VDAVKHTQEMRSFINLHSEQTVRTIKTVPEYYFDDIRRAVVKGVTENASKNQIAKEIQAITKVAKQRARLIAVDQVAKLNSGIESHRALANGAKKYEWETREDSKVRHDHHVLNGTIQSWDSPPVTVTSGKRAGERNHPGGDINCRCTAKNIYEPKRKDAKKYSSRDSVPSESA